MPTLETDQSATKDETLPGSRWSFDDSVTQVFDDMLMRSIPQYDVMRNATIDLIIVIVSNAVQ